MKITVVIILIISVFSIWIAVIQSAILLYGALRFSKKQLKLQTSYDQSNLLSVTIMIPAHNESRVIEGTLKKIFSLNYPNHLLQIIVINDNSSDNSNEILEKLQKIYETKDFLIINTDKNNGGKGKSSALNIGLNYSKNELIAIYDADAAPEKKCVIIFS